MLNQWIGALWSQISEFKWLIFFSCNQYFDSMPKVKGCGVVGCFVLFCFFPDLLPSAVHNCIASRASSFAFLTYSCNCLISAILIGHLNDGFICHSKILVCFPSCPAVFASRGFAWIWITDVLWGIKVLICLLVVICDRRSNLHIGVFLGSNRDRYNSLLSVLASFGHVYLLSSGMSGSVCILMRR